MHIIERNVLYTNFQQKFMRKNISFIIAFPSYNLVMVHLLNYFAYLFSCDFLKIELSSKTDNGEFYFKLLLTIQPSLKIVNSRNLNVKKIRSHPLRFVFVTKICMAGVWNNLC